MLQELSHLPQTHNLLGQEKKHYQEIMYQFHYRVLAFLPGNRMKLIMKLPYANSSKLYLLSRPTKLGEAFSDYKNRSARQSIRLGAL